MSLFGFTEAETVPYVGILILVLYIFFTNYKKGFYGICSPLMVVAVIYVYYCLIGPYRGVSTGETFDRLLNMRPFYTSALWGAFISLLSIVIGFTVNTSRAKSYPVHKDFQDTMLDYYGKRVFLAGFILYAIATKGSIFRQINPLDAAEGAESIQVGFANYLNLSINFLIPGVTLLFAYFVRTRKGFWWVIIPFVIAFGLFTTLGFRYRIILLIGAMGIAYYLIQGKKPNLIFITAGIFALITFMGIMNITRHYGRGLDLKKLKGGTETYYAKGLDETRIFQTSGAIIDLVPEKHPYVGIDPLIITLLFPIPRAIFPQKASGEYLFDTLDAIYGKGLSKGAACMMYGEYYLMFGWPAIILGGFLIGWFSKKLWSWYLANWQDPVVIVSYAVTVVFLYMVISRGYLPAISMLYFFSAFPAYWVYRQVQKRSRLRYGQIQVMNKPNSPQQINKKQVPHS